MQYCPSKFVLAEIHIRLLRPCLHGTGGTGLIFERLSVQVWDLKKAGPKTRTLQKSAQKFAQFRRSRVNARWNRARFCPAKTCPDPCKRDLSN